MKIDTTGWKEFRLYELFDKIQTKKLPYKAGELKDKHDDVYCLPALTAGIENQGLSCFVPKANATILKNCISVSANGANTGAMFYQDVDFTVLQDSYALELKEAFSKHRNKNSYCFLITCMQKVIKGNFDWSNKAGWEKIKSQSILLPVIENPDPNHAYTVDDIDWNYMAERIEELEAERIEELEAERIEELEAYLAATGLDDYELTDEDKEILSLSPASTLEKDGYNALTAKNEIEFREFKIGDLFELKAIKQAKSQKDIPFDDDGIIYVVQSQKNNMVKSKVNKQWLINHNEPIIKGNAIVLGVTLPAVSYQSKEFGASQVITARATFLNERNGLYFVTLLKRKMEIFSYARKPGMQIYKNMALCLPVIPNADSNHIYTIDDINFDYMERYIRAIEKQTIASVYECQGKVIEKTKEIIN